MIGCIGFGGGSVLIPVIQKTAVDDKKLLTQDEYEEDIVVASITPGALPVELSGGIGKRIAGQSGMLLLAGAMALPGAVFTVLLISLLNGISDNLYKYVALTAVGVMSYICGVLLNYVVITVKRNKVSESKVPQVAIYAIITLVFIVTSGKNIYRIIGLDRPPLLGLSTIHVFAMAFFVIFFCQGKITKINVCISGTLCCLYICCVGKTTLISNELINYEIKALMVSLAVWGLTESMKERHYKAKIPVKEIFKEILIVAVGVLVAVLISLVAGIDGPIFVVKGFLSSIMSFGGGDAYLTVADGMFVQSGLIDENDFYASLVPIVNILPGSILCKTLSGIGYLVGYELTGNMVLGYLVGLSGFICSVSASCGVFAVVGDFYYLLTDFSIFMVIKQWIRPIVSGLMLTVISSLIYQCIKFGCNLGCGYWLLGLMGFELVGNTCLDRLKVNFILRVCCSIIASLSFGLLICEL